MAAKKQTTNGPRIDPVPRRLDGVAGWLELENKDPTKHYVLAYDLDQLCGRAYLSSLGYTVEKHSESGVKFKNGDTGENGSPMTWRGHVLMSIDKESREEIDADGRAWANRVEQQIVNRRIQEDLLRGVRGQYIRVTNHSTGLSRETSFDTDLE